MARFILNLI